MKGTSKYSKEESNSQGINSSPNCKVCGESIHNDNHFKSMVSVYCMVSNPVSKYAYHNPQEIR